MFLINQLKNAAINGRKALWLGLEFLLLISKIIEKSTYKCSVSLNTFVTFELHREHTEVIMKA